MNLILVIGGAHIDRKGTMSAPYIKGSSIPGSMHESIGGSGFNVAVNLARLNQRVTFSSPRPGSDITLRIQGHTQDIKKFTDHPIDVEGSIPSYTALIDQQGELVAALADMKLYEELTSQQIMSQDIGHLIKNADILVTDGNFQSDILLEISEHVSKHCQWYAVATSPAKVIRYMPVIRQITLLGMNLNEAKTLTSSGSNKLDDQVKKLKELGLQGAIITNGSNPAICFLDHADSVTLAPQYIEQVVDVTGAGDATLSGFIAGITSGKSIKDALADGFAAAQITIQSQGAQNADLNLAKIAHLRKQFG